MFAPANGIISFGVIRNPYTRCISSWKYCESTRPRTLLDCLKTPPDKKVSCRNPGHDYKHFTLPQSHWLYHFVEANKMYSDPRTNPKVKISLKPKLDEIKKMFPQKLSEAEPTKNN